jgi:hypothetical protein
MLSVPVLVPVAVGWNFTVTLQLVPFARLLPQVLLATAKFPLMLMLLMLTVVEPTLLRVTDCVPLVVPTGRAANVKLDAESLICVPVPLSGTVLGVAPPVL